MTRLVKMLLLMVVLAVVFTPALQAQSSPTRTTLSTAMTAPGTAGAGTMVVASATGITASTTSLQSYCLIDQELVQIRSISSTTLTVLRAKQGLATAHASGKQVFCGYSGTFNPNTGTISTVVGSPAVGASVNGATFVGTLPVGACTRTQNAILPVFFVTASPTGAGSSYGNTVDCLGGSWVPGTLPDYPGSLPLIQACNVPIGSVAYGSFGTSTTTANNVLYTASLFVPNTVFATGLSNLNGSAVDGASKKIFILYDSAGKLIANTATAGTAATGNDAFQQIAFTATRIVVGPALYYFSLQDDTADVNGIRTVAASTFNNLFTANPSSTFGTVAASITAPTTFTADIGPIGCLY